MKSFSFFMMLFLLSLQLDAQTPQVPSGNPGQPGLPAPKLKLPADLTIWCYGLTARKTATGETFIRVTVAVKNSGQIASNSLIIRGLINPNTANAATIATPPVHYHDDIKSMGSWKFCTAESETVIEAVGPGETVRREFEFKILTTDLGNKKKSFFCALADYFKTTMESNENNNMSGPVGFLNPNY